MAWKKGAVVIVKRGDEEWGDAIENALNIQTASRKEVEELENENKNLKRDKDLSKIHDERFTNVAISDLKNRHKQYRIPPKPIRIFKEGLAFFVYWISIFVDKYLVIK